MCVCPIWCSGMCSDFQSIGRGFDSRRLCHTRLSSVSQTPPDFSFILLGGYQQPVQAGVCDVMRVHEKKLKKLKRPQSRDSLARKATS